MEEPIIEEEYDVTTNEIMSYLKEHMVTKEEFKGLEGRMGSMETRMERVEKAVTEDIPNQIKAVKYDTATLLRNKEIITKQEGLEYMRGAV